MPLGISTSSGTVGHSLSFGRADALTVLAENAVLVAVSLALLAGAGGRFCVRYRLSGDAGRSA